MDISLVCELSFPIAELHKEHVDSRGVLYLYELLGCWKIGSTMIKEQILLG